MFVLQGEMKKLKKEDWKKADKLVNQGGKQVASELKDLAPFRMTLAMSTDDFFAKPIVPEIDGKIPVLLVSGLDAISK